MPIEWQAISPVIVARLGSLVVSPSFLTRRAPSSRNAPAHGTDAGMAQSAN